LTALGSTQSAIDMDNAAVSNTFGTLGAVCWSIQLLPQIVLNYQRHSARGLSAPFMMYPLNLVLETAR